LLSKPGAAMTDMSLRLMPHRLSRLALWRAGLRAWGFSVFTLAARPHAGERSGRSLRPGHARTRELADDAGLHARFHQGTAGSPRTHPAARLSRCAAACAVLWNDRIHLVPWMIPVLGQNHVQLDQERAERSSGCRKTAPISSSLPRLRIPASRLSPPHRRMHPRGFSCSRNCDTRTRGRRAGCRLRRGI
jgi:hypothetical protein